MAINKTVLITGGAKRIGLAIAKYLHNHGFNIVVTYNTSSKDAKLLHDDLNLKRKNSCMIVKMNFNLQTNYKVCFKKIYQCFGRLDVLINNASKFYPTKINDISEKSWNDIIDTNLKTPLMLSKLFFNELKKNKGCIINIIDIHIDPPLKDHIIYNISKAGLLALTKTLAKELAPHVRVNGISPGAIMWAESDAKKTSKKKDILSRIPLKKTGTPDDIAKAVLFLIKDADYITGQNINIDGGRKLNM
ncbi:MAG: pteridine reductase [Gammaproteobacteria bacterium]|nr:pteridine reductase [Gammaproteobacteria bacterium]|tara:strand:+ start:2925 stop:3665 length:741 start_codon:yes stop_codon:yes gene_type:complete